MFFVVVSSLVGALRSLEYPWFVIVSKKGILDVLNLCHPVFILTDQYVCSVHQGSYHGSLML